MEELKVIRGTTPENASASASAPASNSISPVGGASSTAKVTTTLMGTCASTATKVAESNLQFKPVPELEKVFDEEEVNFQAVILDLQAMEGSGTKRKRTNKLPTSLERPATRAQTAKRGKQLDSHTFMGTRLKEGLTELAKGLNNDYKELDKML